MNRSRIALLALLAFLATGCLGCGCEKCDGAEVDWDFVGGKLKAQEQRLAALESEVAQLKVEIAECREACRCETTSAEAKPEDNSTSPNMGPDLQPGEKVTGETDMGWYVCGEGYCRFVKKPVGDSPDVEQMPVLPKPADGRDWYVVDHGGQPVWATDDPPAGFRPVSGASPVPVAYPASRPMYALPASRQRRFCPTCPR